MKPTVIQLDIYGDHRDNKSGMYAATLEWEKIIHNLNLEDCLYILSLLYNNILLGEKIANRETGHNAFATYTIWERGSEVWTMINLKDVENTIDQIGFSLRYDKITHQLSCSLGHNHIHTDGSCYILIYEYFKNKK